MFRRVILPPSSQITAHIKGHGTSSLMKVLRIISVIMKYFNHKNDHFKRELLKIYTDNFGQQRNGSMIKCSHLK
jgi:hypothetical protein